MATRKQRAANRRNAQFSTGPNTPEGKAAGPLETALVHQIVMAQWRLARCRGIETGLFELGLSDHEDDFEEHYNGLNNPQKLAFIFRWSTDTLSTLNRYEARIERAFYRALHELQRLQAARQHPDPPPPAKTDFAEQTQGTPETQPNPLPQNGLTPAATQIGNAELARIDGENPSNRVLQHRRSFSARNDSPAVEQAARPAMPAVPPAGLPAWRAGLRAPVCPAWAESYWMKGANRSR